MTPRPDIHVVIMAAGKGTRMKTLRPKVLHPLAGTALIEHVVQTARALDPASITVVVGHQADEVMAALGAVPGLQFALQQPQLGTGHAVLVTEPLLGGTQGLMLLLSGDVPLLEATTARALVDRHRSTEAAVTVLTAVADEPGGLGRVIRSADGGVDRIVEVRDASPAELAVAEINSGVYVFNLPDVFADLHGLGTANAQGEYYLPDLVLSNRTAGRRVEAMQTGFTEVRGVNSQAELAELGAAYRNRRNLALMAAGVTIVDPQTTWVGPAVEVGADTILHPGVWLAGKTRIGTNCEIHSGSRLVDATIDDDVLVRAHTVVEQSTVDRGAKLGPFAHLRPDSHVGPDAHVGNFVELKKTTMAAGAKASHLAYLGDATVGEKANIGAGTITCNYDGVHKHRTSIGAGAFIGSDSQLVAPVSVGDGAFVAAGSTITQDVPAGALGIARGTQVNKDGWAAKRSARR